jgi:glycosyltransferase involved in cell wall biosynthesis
MKVALISRSTLLTVAGGDTVQITETARHLRLLGVQADILLANQDTDLNNYDLLHFFNITRPADILRHIKKTKKPFVISPIWIEYDRYDKYHRTGIAATLLKKLTPGKIEYIKTVARGLRRKDKFPGIDYLVQGQDKSIHTILAAASMILPVADEEFATLKEKFTFNCAYESIPAGIDTTIFSFTEAAKKEDNLVLCVARIEGLKNQLQLIKALNNTAYQLYLVGSAAPNQQEYYEACKKIAAPNISFLGYLPQTEIKKLYQRARVHVLPGWYESFGLSSLEAAAMGCNVVITKNGFASSFFGEDADYCDPASPESILAAVDTAAKREYDPSLIQKIQRNHSWKVVAEKTAAAYYKIVQSR